jgi:hypothetical protein
MMGPLLLPARWLSYQAADRSLSAPIPCRVWALGLDAIRADAEKDMTAE